MARAYFINVVICFCDIFRILHGTSNIQNGRISLFLRHWHVFYFIHLPRDHRLVDIKDNCRIKEILALAERITKTPLRPDAKGFLLCLQREKQVPQGHAKKTLSAQGNRSSIERRIEVKMKKLKILFSENFSFMTNLSLDGVCKQSDFQRRKKSQCS